MDKSKDKNMDKNENESKKKIRERTSFSNPSMYNSKHFQLL